MDRRRRLGFVPMAESLDRRQMLTTGPVAVVPPPTPLPSGVELASLQQKQMRIERFPAFLQSLDPDRPLPGELVRMIQADMELLLGRLSPVPSNGLSDFNRQLRDLQATASVRAVDAANLNASLGRILLAAGAPADVTSSLQASLDQLTHITIQSSTAPTGVMANDYGLVLQVVLAVGRPLPPPGQARLIAADDTPPRGDNATTVRQPTLSGRYETGTIVRILDPSYVILGSAPVGADGEYEVRFDRPLPEGRQVFRIQAVTPDGAPSLAGRPFALTIRAETPQGPRALGGSAHR